MIEVLLVDDHKIFRAGLVRLMADESDIRITGEAGDSAEAMLKLRAGRYDLVMMDINMGPRNGLEALASIRREFPRQPVIMLSMYEEAQYARRAVQAGAKAYLTKDVSPDELLLAVRRVARGGRYLPTALNQGTLSQGNAGEPAAPAHHTLSPREMQVMQKIARGISLTEIGVQMCVSVKTISTHRAHILEKLGLSTNAELIRYALRHRLVD